MKQYLDLLQNILDNGIEKESGRANMPNTIGISNGIIRMNLQDGFPLLTTKKMYWKGIVHELLWFLKGDTNIKYLVDNNVHIWDSDAYRWYLKFAGTLEEPDYEYLMDDPEQNKVRPFTMEEFIENIKSGLLGSRSDYKLGDLGKVYGENWRRIKKENKSELIPVNRPIPNLRKGVKRTYLGVANGSGKEGHILKKTWEGMIARCYDSNSIEYPHYGACNVYVSDSWLEFKIFAEDATKLSNWNLKKDNPRKYVLDKDGIGDGYCYSLETCQWITPSENCNLKFNKIYVVQKDGIEYKFENPSSFCREHEISNKNFSDLWTSKKNTKKRYGFSLISIENKNKYIYIDQIAKVIDGLQKNPYSRYHIIDSWNVVNFDDMALPPCHLLYQFIVRPLTLAQRLNELHYSGNFTDMYNDSVESMDAVGVPKFYLDLNMYQRSVDTFLGAPFNLASMSLLLKIFACACNMEEGIATWIGGDTHLYLDHIELAKEQIKKEPYELPKLFLKRELSNLNDILQLTIDDFELIGYESHEAIKAELFTGLKK